jgi:putative transposase
MDGIVPRLRWADKQKFLQYLRHCRDGPMKQRYLIIHNLLRSRPASEVAAAVGVARSTVYRVARRFCDLGEAGLLDQREDNGQTKLDEAYLQRLYDTVKGSPLDYGWKRPTWTREMLVETLRQQTDTRIHVATMSRALHKIGARRGRPRPIVGCPWSKSARNRRLGVIRRLLAGLPRRYVAVYADEVDIHLNPKIGLDWMVHGQQKEVLTPGQNAKRYLAGAMDARTRRIIWAEGEHKNSTLFIELLQHLRRYYGPSIVIHVILDNFRIHTSQITRRALAEFEGRIVLHFLPPYCPNENRIERMWQDLHAGVTRNHRCETMTALMHNVRCWLRHHNQKSHRLFLKQVA